MKTHIYYAHSKLSIDEEIIINKIISVFILSLIASSITHATHTSNLINYLPPNDAIEEIPSTQPDHQGTDRLYPRDSMSKSVDDQIDARQW